MSPAPPPDDRVAVVAERLGALLAAGLPADAARAHLARTEDPATVARLHAALAARGAGDSAVDADDLWRALGATWRIAVHAGAPLRHCLAAIADIAGDEQRIMGDRQVLLAGPTASARLMVALPFVGVALGFLLGVNPIATLIAMPAGGLVLVCGIALILAARRWSRRLLRTLDRRRPAGMQLELLAMALSAGVSIEHGRGLVGAEWAESDDDEQRIVADVLALAGSVGIPAAALLRAEASRLRHDALIRQRTEAARLGVRLLLPLGACVLPAFVLLAVVPVIVGIVSSTTAVLR